MPNLFDKYLEKRLAEPGYRALYDAYKAEIDMIDEILSAMEARRVELGLSKADLARLIGKRPESVRRIFSGAVSNPTLATVLKLSAALGMSVTVKPATPAKTHSRRAHRAVQELRATPA